MQGDFVHQHDAVLDEHTYQSQRTYDGYKVEYLAREKHHQHHTHNDKRQATTDDDRLAVVLEEHDKDGNHQHNGEREVLEKILHTLGAGLAFALPKQAVSFGQFNGFYLCGNGLTRLLSLDAGSRRTLHPLATLTIVSRHHGRLPTDIYLLADLLKRGTAHQRFHDFILVEVTRLQLHEEFLIHEAIDGRKLREDLGIAQVFYRFALLVHALQEDLVLMDALIERTDGDATRSCQQRDTDVIAAQSEGTGSRLVILHGEDGHIGIPVGGDETHLRRTFHDDAGTVCQAMEYSRVRTQELCLDGVFLEHQVVSFQLHVGIGIMLREVCLNTFHILFQGIGRSEVDDEFTICQ